MSIWDDNATGGGLAWYAIAQASLKSLWSFQFVGKTQIPWSDSSLTSCHNIMYSCLPECSTGIPYLALGSEPWSVNP